MKTPHIPKTCEYKAHLYYINFADIDQRTKLIDFLKARDNYSVFHYVPLHSSEASFRLGEMVGKDLYTTAEIEKLFRLPPFYGMTKEDTSKVVEAGTDFFN